MSIKAQIELMGAELQVGETIRDVCPLCEGGSSHEKSLAITRSDTGGLLYVCHRASCTLSPGSTSSNGSPTMPVLQPVKRRKVFEGKVEPLSDRHRLIISKLWGISEPEHWYWTPSHGGRVAMSIRSPKYVHRGWVLRDIRGRSRMKALTYLEKDEEPLSWYKKKKDAPTVLVEDIPSAVRASEYVNAVALLGTTIGASKAEEIRAYATRPIIVALDQDATSKAFDIVMRYAALWGDSKILMLERDLKDEHEDRLREILT